MISALHVHYMLQSATSILSQSIPGLLDQVPVLHQVGLYKLVFIDIHRLSIYM
jgi:hypothetical protein